MGRGIVDLDAISGPTVVNPRIVDLDASFPPTQVTPEVRDLDKLHGPTVVSPASPHRINSPNYYFPQSYEQAFDGHHRYFLELVEGESQTRVASVECPLVNSIQGIMPSAVERTWTMTDLYEEHRGFRQRQFVLAGRSGFLELSLQRFHKFRNFIEDYEQKMAENKSAFVRAKDYRLILNFPFEGESYYCTIMQFAYARETNTTRCSFAWSMQLMTQGFASLQWNLPKNIREFLDKPGDNDDHTDEHHPCFRASTAAALEAPPDADSIYSDIGGVITGVRRGRENASGLGKKAMDPKSSRELHTTATQAMDNTYRKWDEAPLAIRQRERETGRLIYIMGWYNELRQQAGVSLGVQFERINLEADLVSTDGQLEFVARGNAGPMGFMLALGQGSRKAPPKQRTELGRPRPLPFAPRPVVAATACAGDMSLADIAQRVLGSRHLWVVLQSLNGWKDARTRGDGAPIVPGMSLLVPAPEGTPQPTTEDLYGTDLLLDNSTGDLVMVGTTDIAVVRDVSNFRQNLNHRMRTERGSNSAFPAFGLQPRVGESATSNVMGLVMSDVKAQATADHRVARLTHLNVTEDADRLLVAVEVEAVTRARVSTTFPYAGVL